jgi:hypothetical protein
LGADVGILASRVSSLSSSPLPVDQVAISVMQAKLRKGSASWFSMVVIFVMGGLDKPLPAGDMRQRVNRSLRGRSSLADLAAPVCLTDCGN